MAKTNPKKKTSNLTKYNRAGYFFVAPFVIVFLIFSVYPVFRTLVLSFTDSKLAGMPYHFVGLKNYTRVFTDKFFWRALWNTIRIWGVNIVLQLGLAFLLTVVFSDIKYKFKGLPVFRALYYLPNLIAATSVAFLFKTLLDWRYGIAGSGLAALDHQLVLEVGAVGIHQSLLIVLVEEVLLAQSLDLLVQPI